MPITMRFKKRTVKPYGKITLKKQVASIKKQLRNQKPELKFFDHAISDSNITTAGVVEHLTDIAQGDTNILRTGNIINVVSLHLKFSVGNNSLSDGNFLRCNILQWMQQVGDTAPTQTNIYGSATPSPVSYLINVNASRFVKTLDKGKLFEGGKLLNDITTGSSQVQSSYYETFIKFKKPIQVMYNGPNNNDIQKNGLWFNVLSDDGANTADVNGVCRLRFYDS